MYGFFNHAFEKFIIQNYGEEKWDIIRMEAGVFEDSFDDKTVYDDNMIYEILDAASELLDIENEELQELFGETYFGYCLHSNHGTLLSALGGNLFDFLSNVDSLHDHLSLSYAGVMIPTFRVKQEPLVSSITLYYHSDRGGLEYVSKGVIKVAALKLYNLKINIQTIVDVDALKFLITTDDPKKSHLMFPKRIESSRDLIPKANIPKVSPLEFTKAFPFHMIFDRNMILVELGSTLRRILKECNSKLITSYFKLSRPQIDFDFNSIYARLNNAFVLTSLNDVVKPSSLQASTIASTQRTNLRLKGQMIHLRERDVILFLCSPSVSNIEDMRNKGLCLSDIPIHDATRDLVLLSENFQKELKMTHQLGIVNDHLQKIHAELEEEMMLYDRLLFDVLPPMVAKDLRQFNPVPTEKFDSVTLMFSGIVDFSKMCEDMDPFDIVTMLNEIYTNFDTLLDHLSTYVYKVETVGDKYMAASGLPERCSNHAQVICSLTLDMADLMKNKRVKNKNISVTFGIHSGEVVAGVIGQRMPRYCLFGNTVNLTSRTETTGLKGNINITEKTYKLLQEDPQSLQKYHLTERGEVPMKGRAKPMTVYVLERPEGRRMKMPPRKVDQKVYNSKGSPNSVVVSSGVDKESFTLNRTLSRKNHSGSSSQNSRSNSIRSRNNSERVINRQITIDEPFQD